MDVYDYIAAANPEGVYDVCTSYGYDMSDIDASMFGDCARNLVSIQGEPALMSLMECHPDKDFLSQQANSIMPAGNAFKRDDQEIVISQKNLLIGLSVGFFIVLIIAITRK